MKKLLKFVGLLIAIIVVAILGFVTFISLWGTGSYEAKVPEIPAVTITPERIARGAKLSSMLCYKCHFNPGTGKLTGRYLDEAPQFGKIASRNITHDKEIGIGSWTDAQLIYFIRTGIHPFKNKYIPPYMPKLAHISDEDLNSLIAYLRSEDPVLQASNTELPESELSFLTKFLCFVAFKPFPLPEAPIADPDTNNQVEWGKYIALNQMECFSCHSKNFKSNDYFNPEKSEGFFGGGNDMTDMDGNKIYTRNLTMDEETGIGKWTEDQFVKAVITGVLPSGPAVRYPMVPYTGLSESEAKAIYAYLKTIPKISNKVERGI